MMSLAYPGKSSTLSDIVERDAFLEALDDQALRIRILEKEPKHLDDALNMASRLEAFDMMGYVIPEIEKSKSRFARSAAGGKELNGAGEGKMSKEILKQLTEVNGLVGSYRRDLDMQQQELELMKRNYQLPHQGYWSLPPAPQPAGLEWSETDNSNSVFTPAQSTGLGRGPGRNGGGIGRVVDLNRGTPVETVGERARGCRETVEPGSISADIQARAGGSVSIVTDDSNGVDVYFALVVGGRRIYGLLDTGCDMSVVSRRVILNETLKPTAQKLYAANGTEIALLGEVELTLLLANYEVTAAVVVPEEVDDLIPGIDWLGRHHCRWSFSKNLIEIDGTVAKFISRPRQSVLRRIYAVKNTVVSAGHAINVLVTLALSSLRQTSGDWAVEPRSLGIEILVARILMRDEGGRSADHVMKVGESDFVLRQGDFVGEAEQVATVDGEETTTKQPEDEEALSEEEAVSAVRLAGNQIRRKRATTLTSG